MQQCLTVYKLWFCIYPNWKSSNWWRQFTVIQKGKFSEKSKKYKFIEIVSFLIKIQSFW